MTLNHKNAKIIFGATIAFIVAVAISLMIIVPQDVARFIPGNTHGNLMNGGQVLHHNGDTYIAFENSVYRLRADNSLENIFNREGNISGLQAVGNRVYYSYNGDLRHFNLLTAQTGMVDMPLVSWRSPQVIGSWVYFNDGGISKIRENGTHLSHDIGQNPDKNTTNGHFNVQNSRIYFSATNSHGGQNLYTMSIDGSNITLLIENIDRFFVHGDFVYFTRRDERGVETVFVYSMQSGNTTEIFSDSTRALQITTFNIHRHYLIIAARNSVLGTWEVIAIDLQDGHVQDDIIVLSGFREVDVVASPYNAPYVWAINSTPRGLFVWVHYEDINTNRLYMFTDLEDEPIVLKEIDLS